MTETVSDPDVPRLTAPVTAEEMDAVRERVAHVRAQRAASGIRLTAADRNIQWHAAQVETLTEQLLALPEDMSPEESLDLRRELARALIVLGQFLEAKRIAPEIAKEVEQAEAAVRRPDEERCGCQVTETAGVWTLNTENRPVKITICPRCGFQNARA